MITPVTKFLAAITVILLAIACGTKVDTGRNGQPIVAEKTATPSNPDAPDLNNPGSPDVVASPSGSCLKKTTSTIPEELVKLCADSIKSEPGFKDLHPILCEKGHLIAILNRPNCGWDGTPSTMKQFMVHYSMNTDPALDYEDVNASALHVPVTVDKVLRGVRLAFENYPEFKLQGYQWIEGTREQRNLTGKTWEDGVEYRFRADKGLYEIGYQGVNKLYQLSPTLFVHLNRATGDFERIAEFSQIVLYQQQSDNSTLVLKLEHRRIKSTGLYTLAKKSAAELLSDLMKKGYTNATKP